MNNHNPERLNRLGLKGALQSFEGTALVPLIWSSLTGAGIDPSAYDPKQYHHEEYCGFPADSPPTYEHREPNLSPIIQALDEAIETGKVVIERPAKGTVQLPYWSMYPTDGSDPYAGNAWRTAKLTTASLMTLKDFETDEVLAYAAYLGSDGSRDGYVLISTNDVTLNH